MDRATGGRIDAMAHLRQSVADILSTPIGSRVMRREYGSLVPALIDQPDSLATQTRVFSAIASALMRWEPRLTLEKIGIERDPMRPGRATVHIDGRYTGGARREPAPLAMAVLLGASPGPGGGSA
nr:GPW/gp25 family protein [Melaminivora sp.]